MVFMAKNDVKKALIEEINKRVKDRILEQTNADLLIKLIKNAANADEAINIMSLGTTYKKTGLHFSSRLEKQKGETIQYFKKNKKLSFITDESKPVNKLIIGDNYAALQNLLIQYKAKIDVVYIDPPYGKDSMGEFAKTNYDNAITRDNLLSMLYHRLLLAKELLSDDGVIFCSIDDKNQAYVKCLFDDVFGEENFITNFIWEKTQHFGRQKINYYCNADYILAYAKKKNNGDGIKELFVERVKTNLEDAPLYNASNPSKKLLFPKGTVKFNMKDGTYDKSTDEKYKLHNPVVVKNGVNSNDFELSFCSRWSRQTVLDEIKNGTRYWVKTNNFAIRAIYSDGRESKESPKQIIFTNINNENVTNDKFGTKVGTNEDGSGILYNIFSKDMFGYPKPYTLISYLCSLLSKNDITILDFFAGSGTTGHAILNLNKQDGGSRSFILCQLNENLDEALDDISGSAAQIVKNQIALCNEIKRPHELSEITVERLRRIMVGKSFDGSTSFPWIKQNEPYGGNLDVYEIADVANFESTKGKTPFDVIDETLYGQKKFSTVKEKIKWVCSNFERTEEVLKDKLEE